MPKGRAWTDDEIGRLQRLWREGKDAKTISTILNRSASAVYAMRFKRTLTARAGEHMSALHAHVPLRLLQDVQAIAEAEGVAQRIIVERALRQFLRPTARPSARLPDKDD